MDQAITVYINSVALGGHPVLVINGMVKSNEIGLNAAIYLADFFGQEFKVVSGFSEKLLD